MKQKPRSRVDRKKGKTVLRLPDPQHARAAVLNSLTSADAQYGYRHAIDEFVNWYCSETRQALNRIVVLRYRSYLESRQLASGTVNLCLDAVRRLTYEAVDWKGLKSYLNKWVAWLSPIDARFQVEHQILRIVLQRADQ
jgi:hypothetical protein